MKVKNILGIGLRFITIIYVLLALIYGIVFISVDLTQTINFQDSADAAAARQSQLFISIPYIILGTVLLALLIIFYVPYSRKINITNMRGYGIAVANVGAFLSLGFIGIAIYESEISMILCIVPAICLFIYGIFSIIIHKKVVESSMDK